MSPLSPAAPPSPGTAPPATTAQTLLTKEFPARDGDDATIVFTDVTADRPASTRYLADVAHVPGVLAVEPLQIARTVTSPSPP